MKILISGYGNYSIDETGAVSRNRDGFILKQFVNVGGYLAVKLYKKSKYTSPSIHRLLALAFIPNPAQLPFVDHADRNRKNNSLVNLRWTTRQGNQRNVTKHKDSASNYKGVSWHAKDKRWRARIHLDGKCKYLGNFTSEFDAANAYNQEAEKHHGFSLNDFGGTMTLDHDIHVTINRHAQ